MTLPDLGPGPWMALEGVVGGSWVVTAGRRQQLPDPGLPRHRGPTPPRVHRHHLQWSIVEF